MTLPIVNRCQHHCSCTSDQECPHFECGCPDDFDCPHGGTCDARDQCEARQELATDPYLNRIW